MECLDKEQLVCVGPSKTFHTPKDSHNAIEVKANWGRARKQYGPQATDIVVVSKKNTEIDVSL